MKVIGVIPARYGSTRFPGKPLAMIDGVPLLARVLRGSLRCKLLHEIVVATDDERIANLARSEGVRAVMTDSELPSGSDRVWAAAKDIECDVVINIQGDEPLISESWIDPLIHPFVENPNLEMATLGRPMDEKDLNSIQTAKIVLDAKGNALYFSRFPIPYSREGQSQFPNGSLKHIGLYAFRKAFLKQYCQVQPTDLERAEGLEQLRALYLGAKIRVIQVQFDSWGVDTPSDIDKIVGKLRGNHGQK